MTRISTSPRLRWPTDSCIGSTAGMTGCCRVIKTLFVSWLLRLLPKKSPATDIVAPRSRDAFPLVDTGLSVRVTGRRFAFRPSDAGSASSASQSRRDSSPAVTRSRRAWTDLPSRARRTLAPVTQSRLANATKRSDTPLPADRPVTA